MLAGAGPGFAETAPGRDAHGIARAAADGELTALYLAGVDPLRDLPDAALWEQALERTTTVIAHSQFLTEGIREHATIVFPAETHAEKEGTVTHPDGRVQRLRRAIGRQGDVRPEWSIYVDLAAAVGLDLGVLTASMATTQVAGAVPFYAGLVPDAISGTGVRWPDRDAAADFPVLEGTPGDSSYAEAATPNGALRLGTFRSIWAATDVEASPALKFLVPKQRAELSPEDARRLGVGHGEKVVLGTNGHAIEAVVHLRDAAPAGTVFVETGLGRDSANALAGPLVDIVKKDAQQ
jgi:NADH-quinone oxidoreductase subunit G